MDYVSDVRNDGDISVLFDIDFLLGIADPVGGEKQTFRIGELAEEFGVTLRTLRFYEDRGLLKPKRRSTTRIYSRRDRARLRLILLGKLLGFSLTEAKLIIEIYDQPDGKRRQLEVALQRFEEQQKILIEQKKELEASIEAMSVSIDFVRERLSAKIK